jgi:hypothetical protein
MATNDEIQKRQGSYKEDLDHNGIKGSFKSIKRLGTAIIVGSVLIGSLYGCNRAPKPNLKTNLINKINNEKINKEAILLEKAPHLVESNPFGVTCPELKTAIRTEIDHSIAGFAESQVLRPRKYKWVTLQLLEQVKYHSLVANDFFILYELKGCNSESPKTR